MSGGISHGMRKLQFIYNEKVCIGGEEDNERIKKRGEYVAIWWFELAWKKKKFKGRSCSETSTYKEGDEIKV